MYSLHVHMRLRIIMYMYLLFCEDTANSLESYIVNKAVQSAQINSNVLAALGTYTKADYCVVF